MNAKQLKSKHSKQDLGLPSFSLQSQQDKNKPKSRFKPITAALTLAMLSSPVLADISVHCELVHGGQSDYICDAFETGHRTVQYISWSAQNPLVIDHVNQEFTAVLSCRSQSFGQNGTVSTYVSFTDGTSMTVTRSLQCGGSNGPGGGHQ